MWAAVRENEFLRVFALAVRITGKLLKTDGYMLKGVRRRGLTGLKPLPKLKKNNYILIQIRSILCFAVCTKKSVCVVCTLSKMHGHIKSK